jgi:hypothetical protein
LPRSTTPVLLRCRSAIFSQLLRQPTAVVAQREKGQFS